MKHYGANWSKLLIGTSAFVAVLCMALTVMFSQPVLAARHVPPWAWPIPLVSLGLALLWTIRGFEVTDEAVLVQRLVWKTRLPLEGVQSAEYSPNAMKGSLRTCGNGGAFSFSGFYWSRALGSYRAYVTDLSRTVVLRYAKRTVVLSPAEPEAFVAEVLARVGKG